jgi:hypothetical protein
VPTAIEPETAQGIVWWALLLGGVLGGFTRCLLRLRLEFPFVYRDPLTKRTIFLPGFLGDIFVGPVAALVFQAASVGTVPFQTEFNDKGFWLPLIVSIPVGMFAADYLSVRTRDAIADVEHDVIEAAEAAVKES